MHERRTGGNDDPVETEVFDVVLDEDLAGIGTHEFVFPGYDYSGQFLGKFRYFRNIHFAGDIRAAMAHIDADLGTHAISLCVFGRDFRRRDDAVIQSQAFRIQSEGNAHQLSEIHNWKIEIRAVGLVNG